MTLPAKNPSATAGRARLIKIIHVARRDLERAGHLDEPGYREILRAASNGRHESTADMNYSSLKVALTRFEKAGFRVRSTAKARPISASPEDAKVRALWLFLHALGIVKDPSEQALAAYVKRIAKVDDLRWARGTRPDLNTPRYRTELLIETLKKWGMRYLPAIVADLLSEAVEAARAGQLSKDQADLALKAQFTLRDGQGFDKHWDAWEYLMKALGRPIPGQRPDAPADAEAPVEE